MDQFVFFSAHLAVVGLMIVSQQMEQAVEEEQGDFLVGRVPQLCGFGPCVIDRDDDRPQRHMILLSLERETQDIGGMIDRPVLPVEFTNGRIVDKDQLNVTRGLCLRHGFDRCKLKRKIGSVFKKNHAEVYPKLGKIRLSISEEFSMKKTAVCIISGGMDSALAATIARQDGYAIVAVHFNYGQRTERKELESFRRIADDLGAVERYEIDLPFFVQIGASALTDASIEVPVEGVEEGVPVTYVPFRNGIFLSIASALAEKHRAEALYIGVVEEDSSGYPDCRESYITAMERAVDLGTRDETHVAIRMPLVHLQKSQIVTQAMARGVDLSHTWSCYQNEEEACGVCDSCRLRLRGFELAGVEDPIAYC